MGYFDRLIGSAFSNSTDGKTVFYPYGILGSGYELSEKNNRKIRVFLKRYVVVSLIVLIISFLFFRAYGLFLLVALLPVYMHKISSLLSTQAKLSGRLTFRDSARNMARSMGLPTCILLLIGNCILLLGSMVCVAYSQNIWVGILGVVFFGVGVVHSSFLIKYGIRDKALRVSKNRPQS